MHRSATLDRKASSGQLKSAVSRGVREHVIRLLRTEIEFISNKSFCSIDRVFEREVLRAAFRGGGIRCFVAA